MDLLSSEEFEDIAAWAASASDGLMVHADRLAEVDRRHNAPTDSDLRQRVASLLAVTLEIMPVAARTPASQADSTVASLQVGLQCACRLLSKNDRPVPDVFFDGRLQEVITRAAAGPKAPLTDGMIERLIRPFVPDDEWACDVAKDQPAVGLSAAIGMAVTGATAQQRAESRAVVDLIGSGLRSIGFRVAPPIVHAIGEDCSGECVSQRSVDLFVALYAQPSTRLGHQLKGVSDHLGISLILVSANQQDYTCLFKQRDQGIYVPVRFNGSPARAREAAVRFALDNIDLLRARSEIALTVSSELLPEYLELRSAVARVRKAERSSLSDGLMTHSMVNRMLESVQSYGASSRASIAALRGFVGLAGSLSLERDYALDVAEFFDEEQIAELDQLLAAGAFEAADRNGLLAAAARDLVSGRGQERRRRSYRAPDDWLKIAALAFPERYGES